MHIMYKSTFTKILECIYIFPRVGKIVQGNWVTALRLSGQSGESPGFVIN